MPIQVSVLLETYSNTGINWKRKKRLTLNVIFQILPLIDQEGTRSETATARASAEIYRWFNLLQLQLKIQLKKKKYYSYKIQLQLKIHFEILFKICILSTSDTWECSLPSPLKFSPSYLKAKCSFCPLYPSTHRFYILFYMNEWNLKFIDRNERFHGPKGPTENISHVWFRQGIPKRAWKSGWHPWLLALNWMQFHNPCLFCSSFRFVALDNHLYVPVFLN